MTLAGDYDGDGQVELVVLSQDATQLASVRRTQTSAERAWQLEVGGKVSTNLGAVQLPNSSLALGVGRQDKMLRLWLPRRLLRVP